MLQPLALIQTGLQTGFITPWNPGISAIRTRRSRGNCKRGLGRHAGNQSNGQSSTVTWDILVLCCVPSTRNFWAGCPVLNLGLYHLRASKADEASFSYTSFYLLWVRQTGSMGKRSSSYFVRDAHGVSHPVSHAILALALALA